MVGAIIVILIPFLVFAIIFSKGKGVFLLSGYNTLSDSEKAQNDEAAMSKFIGKIMYGICFSILFIAVSEMLDNLTILVIGLILFISLLVFSLVYMKTGNRFKK